MKKYLLPVWCVLVLSSPMVFAKDVVLEQCLAESSDNRHTEQCIEAALARQDKRVLALSSVLAPQNKNIAREIQNEMRIRNVKKSCILDAAGTSTDFKNYLCLIHSSNDVLDALEQKYSPKTKSTP